MGNFFYPYVTEFHNVERVKMKTPTLYKYQDIWHNYLVCLINFTGNSRPYKYICQHTRNGKLNQLPCISTVLLYCETCSFPHCRYLTTAFCYLIRCPVNPANLQYKLSTTTIKRSKIKTAFLGIFLCLLWSFWLIWFINQRALCNHALSIVIVGIVLCWHQHHHCRLCTPPPGTWLDIETSDLVHICTYVPHICTSNI